MKTRRRIYAFEDEQAPTPRKTVKFKEVLQTLKDPKCYLQGVSDLFHEDIPVRSSWRAGG